ncbi:efflux RND transporter periplasmic adaptor subunit [Pedobacter gandavensis]|uniref:Efflux RND transporter periplasmic adaptor subunit n=1 Tax=Pedobacter gandavensis TaxID=2679963 RepID=A0ABR6EUB7_9SPHI|nr:efflux RND transporter periplasmic adaptor subunit [Pedobacter gandavensis]MBB2148863.1 efflux RND transporter periplasmic adaptor subunit [Pedobacter gandavensis]
MNLYKNNLALSLIFAVLMGTSLTACNGKKEKPAEKEVTEVHEDEAEHSDEIELTEQQIKAVGIEIGTIQEKNLTAVVKASGQLAVPPQNEAKVNLLSGGIIRKINVLEGQKVKKGQALAVVENQEMIKLQQDYLSAKNGFSFVDAEYKRQQQLKAADAGTGRSFQLAEANYHTELSKIKALERQLQQQGISPKNVSAGNITAQTTITAPISGTIGTIQVTTGAFVQPGTSLMDIVDNSKIHADLLVYEKDLFKVQIGQKVSFRLTNQDNQQIEGHLIGINKSFEDDTKGVIVHAVITKPLPNLIPGMYVTGLISVGTEKSPAVPIDAVVKAEGKEYIFIVEEEAKTDEHEKVAPTKKTAQPEKDSPKAEEQHEHGTHFKKIEVVTGVSELGYISISPLEKLPKNTRLVVKGAFYLQSKSTAPTAHSH